MALGLGCTAEPPGQRATLRGTTAVALACFSAGEGVRPLTECSLSETEQNQLASDDLRALVLNRDLGEVAVASVLDDVFLDTLPGVPGISHIPVGNSPVDIAVARTGEFAYVLNVGDETVSVVDLQGLCEAGVLSLTGRPAAMLLDPAGTLYLAYPDTSEIAIVDLDDCDVTPGECTAGEIADEVTTRAGADGSVGDPPPACANGRDDDGDGLVDAADAGCADDDDDDEGDAPRVPTRCSDGVDNDGDGLVDLADPGCTRASDDSESDSFPPLGTEPPPACSNDLDDDGDGRADWPADPGCAAAGDDSETPLVAACDDGVDNDGEGGADGKDSGCTSKEDESEAGCDDGARIVIGRLDSDTPAGAPVAMALSPDGRRLYVGHADRSYVSVIDVASRQVVREIGVTSACSNDLNDDGDDDGADYPDDPDCDDPLDDDEAGGDPPGQCSDGVDNDGNGLTDLADPGCESPSDPVELAPPLVARCHDGLDNDGDGLVDLEDPGCRHEDDLDERDPESDPDLSAACSDGVDNDGDGLADLDDPGCVAAGDETESDAPGSDLGAVMPCEDKAEGEDDGCTGPGDLRALLPGVAGPGRLVVVPDLPACSDGLDNDGDGFADFPDDPDCASADGTDEFHVFAPPECSNGKDDDGDGAVDWPDDTDCLAAGDRTEAAPIPACADGLDNDGDGLVDYVEGAKEGTTAPGSDPGCESAAGLREDEKVLSRAAALECPTPADSPARSGDTESAEIVRLLWCPPLADRALDPPLCNDGRDNDDDGLIDNEDPGCASPWDNDEVGVGPKVKECPASDPGCGGFIGAVPVGPRPPACSDGLDNDGDGTVDPSAELPEHESVARCVSALDDSETAPRGFQALVEDASTDRDRVVRPKVGIRVGVSALAVTPDGQALYVLDRAFGWLAVVDIPTGRLVDTRVQTPFHRSKGIEISGVPLGIDFACYGSGEAEVCTAHSPDVLAFVSGTGGEVQVIRTKRGGVPIHQAEDSRSRIRTVADRPQAFRSDGTQVRLVGGSTPSPETPFTGRNKATFEPGGSQGVTPASERGPVDPSGFDFGARSVTDGTWTATWEGALPGSSRSSGLLKTLEPGKSAGNLDVPGAVVLEDTFANFCRVGARPGDRLILLSELDADSVPLSARPACERVFAPEALTGREGPEWCITDVRPHRLALRAVPRQLPAGVHRADGICPVAQPGNLLDPLPAGEPLGDCFSEFVRYRIRVGDQFVVARSGESTISHNWVSSGGECVLRSDAHPLRIGRARVCDPSGPEPCRPFVNAALSMTLFAPSDPELRMERDMAVRVGLVAGVAAMTYRLGALTNGVAVDPNTGRAYITESGFEDLWVVDPSQPAATFLIGR